METLDSYHILKFELYCNSTRVGEIVKVCGSCPELGSWNGANSLTMCTSQADYPIWKAHILISDQT